MDEPPGAFSPLGSDLLVEDPAHEITFTPLWREALAGWDWIALRTSPVYFGCGVPRGRGEPVVIVPGFLASDISLSELFGWLVRIGYQPYFSNIGRNMDCPNSVSGTLLDTVRLAYRQSGGQRVRLVGHSLGGLLARSVALDHPELVAGVITLGAPFRETVRAHPAIFAAAEALRRNGPTAEVPNIRPLCFSGHCTCNFVKNMLNPDPFEVPHFAVFSANDGVVEWESCVEEDPALNDEVSCTHLGMVFHPAVYRVLGERLAQMDGHVPAGG
jgi:pimeloyl-ACP methyl ester carboxylesterase